jgi:hypothetical protein
MADTPDLSLGKIAEGDIYNFLRKFNPDSDDSHNFSSTDDIDSPYKSADFLCNYIDENSFASRPSCSSKKFSLLSLNIQSLPAKFAEFLEFITDCNIHNNAPDVICLQEIWNVVDANLFPLPGYHPFICKTRSKSTGGGVGIYVRTELAFKILPEISIFLEKTFESLFLEITLQDKQKIIIGSA